MTESDYDLHTRRLRAMVERLFESKLSLPRESAHDDARRVLQAEEDRTRAMADQREAVGEPAQMIRDGWVPYTHSVQMKSDQRGSPARPDQIQDDIRDGSG